MLTLLISFLPNQIIECSPLSFNDFVNRRPTAPLPPINTKVPEEIRLSPICGRIVLSFSRTSSSNSLLLRLKIPPVFIIGIIKSLFSDIVFIM